MADATITLETKWLIDFQSQLASLKKQLDGVTDSAGKGFKEANKSASAFLDTFKGFLAATGVVSVLNGVKDATFGMASGFIKANAAYETSITSFRTLLKDGNKAKALMEDLTKFSIETPFESEPINQAAKSLLAFGSSSKNVVNELRMLGDIASGVGAPLGEIAEIYGKNRVQGRLFMQDINQLTNRGIPIIQELAKQFKVSESAVRDLVEKGKIGFPQLEKAFQNLTAEGGQFNGMMKQQSTTFTGLMSTLKESVTQFFVVLGQTGVWAEFVKYLQQAATWIEKNQKTIEEFAKTIGNGLIKTLRFAIDHFKELIGVGAAFFTAFAYAKFVPLVAAFTKAGGAVGVFSKALDMLKAHPALIAIAAIPTVLNAITAAMEENAKKAEEGGFRKNIADLEKLKSITSQYLYVSEQIKKSHDMYAIQGYSQQLGRLSGQFKEITGFTIESAQGQSLLNSKTKDGISILDLQIKKLKEKQDAQADAAAPVEEAKAKAKELTPEEIEAAKKRKEQILKQTQELEDAKLLLLDNAREKELQAHDLKHQRELEQLAGNKEAIKALNERYAIEEKVIMEKHDKTLNEKRTEAMKKRLANERNLQEAIQEEREKTLEIERMVTEQSIQLGYQLIDLGETVMGKNKTFFMMNKAVAFAESIVNTALGVTSALAKGDVIRASFIGIMGGLKTATIGATAIQGFEEGGMIHGKNRLIMTNEDGRTEAVLNHRAVRSIGPDGVAALNSGQGIGSNVSFGDTVINISGPVDQMTVRQIDDTIRRTRADQLRDFQSTQREARSHGLVR